MTTALASGGRAHFGWGVDRHLAANLYDAMNLNTRATGNWREGKAPNFPEFPRPSAKEREKQKKPKSVKDIFALFTGRKD